MNIWAQSFTSLKADFRQDINGGFALGAGALMEDFFEGNAPLRHCGTLRRVTNTHLLF